MVEKDKDLFLDILENPNLTLEDLVSVGHSAESTRFLDKSMYENSQRVRDKFMDSDGNFKLNEFDSWYNQAAKWYLDITNKDTNLSLLNVTAFDESDITVSPEKRTLNTKPIVSFGPNPDRQSTSVYRIGKTSERERSQSELAQAEKILLNPVEATKDPSKAKWGDSPNDSWWGNFFDTQVLALWDEDGEHIDPVTKQKVKHTKGEYKLNDNGTYYYESLDGRDVYGKQVLNKFNTITTDGSFWNQYDFFDSDDINEKSFVGSVAKNLALVGSMFIPHVGWGIAGASILTQVAGLTGTFGKMLTGSDSPTFSAMEGWAKSFDRQSAKSEYAQQNMLCWENFIDLIGDTTAQLREQRAIFKFVPALFGKGKYGIESKHFGMNSKALMERETEAARKAMNPNLNMARMASAVEGEDAVANVSKAIAALENIVSRLAEKEVLNYFENYNKLGEQLARAYMIGITVGDTYGEAKQAGATDFEAAMLTIGYAAAENKLLKSELGRWIFPELKAERATLTKAAEVLTQAPGKVAERGLANTLRSSGVKEAKAAAIAKSIAGMSQDTREASKFLGKLGDNKRLDWMKKWFNAGKDAFNQLKSVFRGTLGAMVSNALAEGTEEVSEELLKDFSTSCFNIVKAAQGNKDVRMQGFLGEWDWNEALKRYGMSFFGGLIGGGINSAAYDYRNFKDIANMTSEQAFQKLVWMDRNNELDKFWDVVSKQTLGDKYHSTEMNEDGTYKLGDKNHNQDLEVKKALRKQLDLVHNILAANGASINDEGLIGQIMNAIPDSKNLDLLGDFRTNALATSVTAGRFLKEYNTLCKAIVVEAINLKKLNDLTIDSKEPSQDLQNAITESQSRLAVLQKAKDDLLQGKRTEEFYRDALFETTYALSESFIAPTEVQFMELMTNKPYNLISDKEKEDLKLQYVDWSKTERSEQIHKLADIFYGVAQKTSQALQESTDMYEQMKQGHLNKIQQISKISLDKLISIQRELNNDSDEALGNVLRIISEMSRDLGTYVANPLGLTRDVYGDIVSTDASLSVVQEQVGNANNEFTNKINEIVADESLSKQLKENKMATAFFETIGKNLTDTAQEIISAGYIHPEVTRNLVPVLKQTRDYYNTMSMVYENSADDLNERLNDFDNADLLMQSAEEFDKQRDLLDLQIKDIEALSYTPIIQNLKTFGLTLGTDENVLSLIESAIKKEADYQEAIDNILLDLTQENQFDEAEKLLKLYRTAIIASRVDNADVGHIFGYNKVLNELCGNNEGFIKLAEIDANTASYAIQDVNLALERLAAIRGISNLNQGNKLNIQNYTSANKNYILYNKTKKLITTLLNEDDPESQALLVDWNKDSLLELQSKLDSMTEHARLSADKLADRKLSLSLDERIAIEKEQHLMDDAIYLFFQDNQDKLADTDEARVKLAQFIKASKLDFYDKNEGLLTQASEDIDDGSYVWWLASKAALKGSEFYNVYRKVIQDNIAPIPTQELGIYAAIAAIYNGNVFRAFGKAMKQFIYEDWKSKSDAKRKKDGTLDLSEEASEKVRIVKAKGLFEELPIENSEIARVLSCDLVPSYTNILFIEGIPGSGNIIAVYMRNHINHQWAISVKTVMLTPR